MGNVRARAVSRDRAQHDIGTLWTLKRGESKARCALVSLADGLELRVLMDGSILRSELCDGHEQAFALAERWQTRMMDRGWTRLLPPAGFGPDRGSAAP